MGATLRAVVAVIAGLAPRRYWPDLDARVPVVRAALASALATIVLAAAIGIPAFVRYAEGSAARAVDLTLEATGWRATPPGAETPSDDLALGTWTASFFSLFAFAFFTPIGLLVTYLAATGFFRLVSVIGDDAHGDPVLTAIDAVVLRVRRATRARRATAARERLEGPAVPDRLVSGRAAGFPGAAWVVVASRRKPGWDAGVFVVADDAWYRLAAPVERLTPAGLRTLYPLEELRDHEAARRVVRYDLPPVNDPASKAD